MFGYGAQEDPAQRGLVHRTLEHLFHVIKEQSTAKDTTFTVLLSFIEIYLD